MEVLSRAEWQARADAHAERIDAYVAPHLARRADQVKHPVHDFLFTYYSYRPAQLRRWHPGFGIGLSEAPEHASLKAYSQVECASGRSPSGVAHSTRLSKAYVLAQHPLIEQLHRLLVATASRPAHFGCFGLHEWAMVYRLHEDETRHPEWPLRLGPAGTDAVVESHRIACSHFDAFRFFTPAARPLNILSPGRNDRENFEQPGCLHAGMDLYKHAFRLSPMISSDLVADCFELAWDIRALDMRASAYDLTGLHEADGEDWSPVRIETPEGKAAYVEAQRGFSERAAPLRRLLSQECERLLGVGQNS